MDTKKDSYVESSRSPAVGVERVKNFPILRMSTGDRHVNSPPGNFIVALNFQLGFAPVYNWNHHCNRSCQGKDL